MIPGDACTWHLPLKFIFEIICVRLIMQTIKIAVIAPEMDHEGSGKVKLTALLHHLTKISFWEKQV